jgi:WhiB family redox-sensing transcriptional regulator
MTARRHLGEIVADRPGGAQPTPVIVVPDEPWRDDAICAQTDPEAFFPEKGGSTREAKQICRSCDVRPECLDYALAHNERFGIWGGMSERDRRKLIRQLHPGRATQKRLDEGQAAEVVRRYAAGQSRQHLSAVYAVPDYAIRGALEEAGVEIRGPGGQPARVRDPQPWADSDEWRHGRHIEDVTLPDHEQEQTA